MKIHALAVAVLALALTGCAATPQATNGIQIGIVSASPTGTPRLAMPGHIAEFEPTVDDLTRMQLINAPAPAGQQIVLMDRNTASRAAAPINLAGHVQSNAAVQLSDGTIVWGRVDTRRTAAVPLNQ
jgi:hypothetical protein